MKASGKAITERTPAMIDPINTRRPILVKKRPADHIVIKRTAAPGTTAPREPDIGTAAAVANVAMSAHRRRRGFWESRPRESKRAGIVMVKATNPLKNVNVEETRARPVLATVAMSAAYTSSPSCTV